MAKEVLIVEQDELSEYAQFGWNFDKSTPEGKAVLSRENDDPKIKKILNQEMKYRSIKSKIKKLELPEKPANGGLVMSPGLIVLIGLFTMVGFLLFFYKPGLQK